MALIENIQREDLNPLEEARGLQRLTEEFGLTHEAAAQAVGRSRSATSNLLRLLQLSEPVQQLLLGGATRDGSCAGAAAARRRGADPGGQRDRRQGHERARGREARGPSDGWQRAAGAAAARETSEVRATFCVSNDNSPTHSRPRSRSACATAATARAIAARSRSPSLRSTSSTACSAGSATSGADPRSRCRPGDAQTRNFARACGALSASRQPARIRHVAC